MPARPPSTATSWTLNPGGTPAAISTTLVLRSIRLPSPDVSSNGYRSLVEKNGGGIRAREYFIYHRNCFFSLFCRDDDICQRGLFPSGNLLQRGYEVGKERELNWTRRFTTDESTNKIHFVLLTFSNRVRTSSIILR